jgi:NO-binding membrane sensor protein with MHYT domain/two-component sensor histidine kinase
VLFLTVHYNPLLVVLSILVAIFASYVALELAHSVTQAKRSQKSIWLFCGSIAMGFGIWSMHFVGMLAADIPGVPMAYDISLMVLSILIAVFASALALYILSRAVVTTASIVAGGIAMAAAIAGMHYTGMYSMQMPALIVWNPLLVFLSVAIALVASFTALLMAIRLRKQAHRGVQLIASLLLGVAISGMHYTGMSAATFIYDEAAAPRGSNLLQSSAVAITVLGITGIILGLAAAAAMIDRAFFSRAKKVEETSRLYLDSEKNLKLFREERELRDLFVSALAHDLRNPLSAARMSMEIILRKAEDVDLASKYAHKAIDSFDRMDQMIQNLLDAHRISAGQGLPLNIERFDLRKLLDQIRDDMTTVYGERFKLNCPSALVGHWDMVYLRRAIENLCTNAIKYGKEETPISLTAAIKNHCVVISVTNLGAPIPQNEQQSLFVLFHRSKSEETQSKRGWGLGLTIVKGVAEAHHGQVSVESTVDECTTFTLEVPVDVRA